MTSMLMGSPKDVTARVLTRMNHALDVIADVTQFFFWQGRGATSVVMLDVRLALNCRDEAFWRYVSEVKRREPGNDHINGGD